MTGAKQVDPCVSLEIIPEGILLTTSAQLQEGVLNWTPEQAGEWFARTWQEAQSLLTLATLQRARTMGDEGVRLVRQGDAAWMAGDALRPEEAPPAALADEPTQTQRATQTLLTEIAEPDLTAEEPSPAAVGARLSERVAETADQRKVIRVINRSTEPLTQASLKRETGLSDYRVKKAISVLVDKGFLRESKVDTGGRWKESAAYSAAEGE